MLGLKAIWAKTKGEAVPAEDVAAPMTSIARQVVAASRADFRPPPPPVAPTVATDTRAAERFVPRRTATVLVSDAGKKLQARIINVSTNGLAVEADFTHIPAQSIVMVGERKVRPGRKITRGTVFVFETPLPLHLCGPDLIV